MIWEATERISSCLFHNITKPSSLNKMYILDTDQSIESNWQRYKNKHG